MNISAMSKFCLAKVRTKHLTKLLLSFLKDKIIEVQVEAYKQLGMFISTLFGLTIDSSLVKAYLRMTDPKVVSKFADGTEVSIKYLMIVIASLLLCLSLPSCAIYHWDQ